CARDSTFVDGDGFDFW
nr:immunoglobulin heavy chain junction region [Macaca mulatta]MOV38493.1 immunoglobulin heavy chain junction region [Macaca mulatta]MOV38786.1 immunoglobulin heavy chain junction region [Macaca mulatta]MOV44793.1 immunoglobulin heavy chain junction region [Macaca mulatta]MOV45049.1 immunoglobulin heavy chain junction region [Macaca mulatta]